MISCFQLSIDHPRDAQPLFENTGFEIKPGSWTEIIGPAACGKSLLFSILSLTHSPLKGKLLIAGRNLERLRGPAYAELRRRIGSCSQNPTLLNRRTVIENLVIPLIVRAQQDNAVPEAEHLLDALSLSDLRDAPLKSLANSQRQAVAMLRAIIGRPPLIIIDDGFDLLCQKHLTAILTLLRAAQTTGSTVILFARQPISQKPHVRHLEIRDRQVLEATPAITNTSKTSNSPNLVNETPKNEVPTC